MKKHFVLAVLAAFSLSMAGNAQNLKGFAYGDVEAPRGYNYVNHRVARKRGSRRGKFFVVGGNDRERYFAVVGS